MLPLRSTTRSRQGEYTVGIPAGHELVVLHRDVVHFLSPIDQSVVWTRSMEVPNGAGSEYRSPQQSRCLSRCGLATSSRAATRF